MRTPNVIGPGTGRLQGLGQMVPLAPYIPVLPFRLGIEVVTGRSPATKEELEQCRLNKEIREAAFASFIQRNGFDALMATADPHGQRGVQRVIYTTPMQAVVNSTGSAAVTNTGPGNTAKGGINQAPVATQPRILVPSIVQAANSAADAGLVRVTSPDSLSERSTSGSSMNGAVCAFNAHINQHPWIAAAGVVALWYFLTQRGGKR